MKKSNRYIIDLGDYMNDIISSQTHILSTSFIDEEENENLVNVLDDNMFKNYFEYFFFNYNMISFRDLKNNEVVDKFNNLWRIFQYEEKENLKKIVTGYYWDYVPVYNYDRNEKWVDIRSGNETDERELNFAKKESNSLTSGGYSDVNTPEGATVRTTTPQGEYTDSTHYDDNINIEEVSTMDNDTWRSKTRTTNPDHTDSTTRSYNQFEEMEVNSFDDYIDTNTRTYNQLNTKDTEEARIDKDDNTHTYNDVTDSHDGHMYGNIGVTTNVDMINQEFELRVHNLGYEFLKRFFDKYFVML